MSMEVKIHKKLGEYELDVYWKSMKKRIGILGASGSGKSLTLKSIAGIEHPDKGYIRVALVAPKDETRRGLIRLRDCLFT